MPTSGRWTMLALGRRPWLKWSVDRPFSTGLSLSTQRCQSAIRGKFELTVSQALSDVVESLLGALFISEDYAIAALEAFFENVMRPFYDEHIRLSSCSTHPTSTLFKILESRSCQRFEMERVTQDKGVVRSDGVLLLPERPPLPPLIHMQWSFTTSFLRPRQATRRMEHLARRRSRHYWRWSGTLDSSRARATVERCLRARSKRSRWRGPPRLRLVRARKLELLIVYRSAIHRFGWVITIRVWTSLLSCFQKMFGLILGKRMRH